MIEELALLGATVGTAAFLFTWKRRNNWFREVARETAHRAKHVRRTVWLDFARERHLQLWRARAGPTYVLRGTREDVRFVADVFLSEAVPSVRLRARALAPREATLRAWRPEAAGDLAELAKGEPAPIGDAEFDEAYRVKGDRDAVPSLLDERVRRALLQVPKVTCFEYDRGDVRLEWLGGEAEGADAAIEAVIAVCARPRAAYR